MNGGALALPRTTISGIMMRSLFAAMLLLVAPAHGQGDLPIWRLSEELRVGSIDGPGALSRVHSLTVDTGGALLFVAQPLDHTIGVFDAVSGKSLRQIARHGEGPGEFRMLDHVGWRADTLYATDFLLKRVSLFSPAGSHYRSGVINVAVDPATGRGSHPLAMTADGMVISRSGLSSAMVAEGRITATPWSLVDWSGRIVRVVGMRDLRGAVGLAKAGTRLFYFTQPMAERSILAVHPDGQVIVTVQQAAGDDRPKPFDIAMMNADGSSRFARSYEYAPQELPPAARDSLVEVLARDLALALPAGRAGEAAREAVAVPTYYPPVSSVVVGRDSTVWLRLNGDGRSVNWLILDSGGDIAARVVAPAELKILFADSDHAWGVVHDEFDVPYVVRMRIAR